MKLCIGHKNCRIAEPVDQLQGGKEGIVFERPSENPNLNRICVRKVDAGIATEPVIFRLIHHLLRRVLVAVPGCPAFQLAACPAAEFQKLVPVLFNEEQKPRNARLLLQDAFAKSIAAEFARAVNFEFDAKISGRGSVENRLGAVAVIVDGAAFELTIAAFAVRLPPSTRSSRRRTASP